MKIFACTCKIFFFLTVFSLLNFPQKALGNSDVLRLLVWGGYVPSLFVKQFESDMYEKYGRQVKLQISYVEKSDDFYDPVREKSVDLITISHHLFKDKRFNFISKNLLLPINTGNIPNHKYLAPFLNKQKYHTQNGKMYGIPVGQGSYGLAFNKKKIEVPPGSWRVLWDPAYRNKYVIGAHEYLYNANITALVLGYDPGDISSFDTLNNKQFINKFEQLASGALSFYGGTDSVQVIRDASLAVIWGDSLKPLLDTGEEWEMVETKEGVPWWIDDYALTWALKDRSFLKQAAEEWINMVISPEFQTEVNVRRLRIYPVVTNINDRLTENEKLRINYIKSETLNKRRMLQPTVSQRDRNGIKLLWDKAMGKALSRRVNK